MEEVKESPQLSNAERYYQNHLNRMREYSKKNRDTINEKNRQYFKRVMDDPEKRELYLQKKREAYKLKKENGDPEEYQAFLEKKRREYRARVEGKKNQNI